MAGRRSIGGASALLAVGLAVTGCATSDSGSGNSASPTPTQTSVSPTKTAAVEFAGTNWQLKSGTKDINWAKFRITLEFGDAQKVSGFSGVNRYSGSYVATAAGNLKFGPMASTKMAGPDDAMAAEAVYLNLLERVTSYRMSGDQLVLLGSQQELLTFAR